MFSTRSDPQQKLRATPRILYREDEKGEEPKVRSQGGCCRDTCTEEMGRGQPASQHILGISSEHDVQKSLSSSNLSSSRKTRQPRKL